jgi:hypothetical protein
VALSDEQVREIFSRVRDEPRFKEWLKKRDAWLPRLREWVKPDAGGLSDEQLRAKFLEYYMTGGGVQTLNQIYRDRIAREIPKFRMVLGHLLDEKVPVEKRIDDITRGGKFGIEGLGKAVVTHFLMVTEPQKYCLWNSKVEMGLAALDRMPDFTRGQSRGHQYLKVLEVVSALRTLVGARDFFEMDQFLHFVGAPEEEGRRALEAIRSGMEVVVPTTAATPPEPGAYVITPGTEKQLEEFIEKNLEANSGDWFGRKLDLYQGEEGSGRQFRTPVGIIDLLTREAAGGWTVIELKKGKSGDAVLGQTMRYMGWVHANLAAQGEIVRGIIVLGEQDMALGYALAMTPNVELYTYSIQFSITRHSK